MAACVNRVLLIGFVGNDPTINGGQGNSLTARIPLATSSRFKNGAGEVQERTEWHNLVAFGRRAEVIRDYVHKGAYLYVEGELRTRSWTDEREQKRYRTEVVLSNIRILDRLTPKQSEGEEPGTADDMSADDMSDVPF